MSEINFQQCSHLEIKDEYSKSSNTLADLMNLQKDIQENVYGYDFKQLQEGKLKNIKSFIDWNLEAIRDEERELQNALGGIHSHSNALWKTWKSKHKEANEKLFSELTEEELKELRMEWIDILHFIFNIGLAIGMDAQTTFDYYMSKNKENRNRQQKIGGY